MMIHLLNPLLLYSQLQWSTFKLLVLLTEAPCTLTYIYVSLPTIAGKVKWLPRITQQNWIKYKWWTCSKQAIKHTTEICVLYGTSRIVHTSSNLTQRFGIWILSQPNDRGHRGNCSQPIPGEDSFVYLALLHLKMLSSCFLFSSLIKKHADLGGFVLWSNIFSNFSASELNKSCIFCIPCGEKRGRVLCLMVPQFISMFLCRLVFTRAASQMCYICCFCLKDTSRLDPLTLKHSPAELLSSKCPLLLKLRTAV